MESSADRTRLLEGCDAAERTAITTPAGPLVVLAGAGSGKTRVLTRRIAWRVLERSAAAPHVLALTFTRKAAGELRTRLSGFGLGVPVTVGTFHAVALAELRRRALERSVSPPVLLESKTRLLAPLLGGARSGRADRELVGAVAAEIEWAAARLIRPDGYGDAAAAAGRRCPISPGALARERLPRADEAEKRRRRVLDFDDLLAHLAEACEREPDFAAAQRWRYRHLFVDEFQDANAAQLRLLDAWLGDRDDLCVVGDPRQAIYAWNGADPDAFGSLTRRFPQATVLRLDANHRSTPQILAVAHAVGGPASATRPLPPPSNGVSDGPVPSLSEYASDHEEAAGVVVVARRAMRPGGRLSEIAVLARTNAQLGAFADAFAAAGVPVRLGRPGSFPERPAVRAALADLARRRPPSGFRSWRADLTERLAVAPGDEETETDGDLADLARLADEFVVLDPDATAEGFRAYLRAALRGEAAPGQADGVELLSFHRAKGLEWRVVFVTGLERGFVPISHATSPLALDEEERLLYVALTRAREQLHCSHVWSRTISGRTLRREPSPYVPAIGRTCGRLATPGSPGTARATIAEGRRRLAERRPASESANLEGALRVWRDQAARAAAVPAFVVLPDSALREISERRPRTVDELRKVPGIGPARAGSFGGAILALVLEARST